LTSSFVPENLDGITRLRSLRNRPIFQAVATWIQGEPLALYQTKMRGTK